MVNGLNSQEDSKKLEVTQNEINMEREKEAIDSIQSQSNELDKYLEGKSEPRFSFMKYLRRDKNRPSEDNEDAPASTSGSGPVLDNNGLPSYSEATMEDTLTAEDSATSSKMVDGATQTRGEPEEPGDTGEAGAGAGDTEHQTETGNPKRFRFFNFTK